MKKQLYRAAAASVLGLSLIQESLPPTPVTSVTPVQARPTRITQTATVADAPAWSMRLLRLYQAAR